MVAGMLVCAALWWRLPALYPDVALGAGGSVEIAGSRFSVPEGLDVSRQADATVVRRMEGQQVVFVTPAFFPAAQGPILRLSLSGAHPDLVTELAWITADAPAEPRFLQLPRGNAASTLHRLAGHERWEGQIVEIGIFVSGLHATDPLRLSALSFPEVSRATLAGLLWQQWRVFSPWRMGSANYYRGFPADAPLGPAPVAAVWALASVLGLAVLAVVRGWSLPGYLPAALTAVMVPWLALDGLWQFRLAEQLDATHERFGGMTQTEKRSMEDDASLQREARRVLEALAPVRGDRLFLLRESVAHNYHRLRLQYHLLPLNVYNFGSALPDPAAVREGDFLALLDSPGDVRFDAERGALVDGDVVVPAEPMFDGERLSLFRLAEPGR
jgi:hypothetical protein